jgi:hypothetical protein
MSVRTSEEQLADVDAAIAAIEGGAQEYKIGWRSVRRADLIVLYEERRRLRHEAAQAYRTVSVGFTKRG